MFLTSLLESDAWRRKKVSIHTMLFVNADIICHINVFQPQFSSRLTWPAVVFGDFLKLEIPSRIDSGLPKEPD